MDANARSSIYPCDKCNKIFERKDSFTAHYKLVHQKIKKQCENCGKYIAPTSLKRHKNSNGCIKGNLTLVPPPSNDSIDGAAKTKKPCPNCGKAMHTCSLRRHMKTVCNINKNIVHQSLPMPVQLSETNGIQCKFPICVAHDMLHITNFDTNFVLIDSNEFFFFR